MTQWFLGNGLLQDLGILGHERADRAVKLPPLSTLGGPSALVPHPTEEFEDEAPERPHVCPECKGAFVTLRQLVAHQTHKHGYGHPPGIVTVSNTCMVSEHLQRSTCDSSSSSTIMETGILCGKG